MQNYDYEYDDDYSNGFQFDYYGLQQAKKNERKEIRKLGLFAGVAILFMILLQNFIVTFLAFVGVYDKIMSDQLMQLGMEMLITIISLLIPFSISGIAMKKMTGTAELLPLEKPRDNFQFLLAIPAGLGICMIANRVTTYIIVLLELFGVELSSPDIPMTTGTFGILASFFRVSVVAAVVEELSLRGFTMQALRKYGDWFAIIMASFVFGLMHCNLIQAPFAMIVGIALGYFSVKTNTLWTGIIIHSLNNAISLALSYAADFLSDETLTVVFTFVMTFLVLFGTICLVMFVKEQRQLERGLESTKTYNGFWGKTGAFLSSPTMIIAIIAMLYFTANYVKLK